MDTPFFIKTGKLLTGHGNFFNGTALRSLDADKVNTVAERLHRNTE